MSLSVGYAPTPDGGQVFHAAEDGEGVPVVFVYGPWYWPVDAQLKLPTDMDFFRAYAGGRPWHVFDWRGKGRSSQLDGPHTLEAFVEDLHTLAGAVGQPAEFHVRAPACPLAVAFAAVHPECISGLVLFTPARVERDRVADRMVLRLAEVDVRAALKLGMISMQEYWIDDPVADLVVSLWTPNFLKGRTGVYGRVHDDLDLIELGRPVRVPVLLLDEPSRLDEMTALAESWPGIHVAIHSKNLKNGGILGQELRRLVARHLPASPGAAASVNGAPHSLTVREEHVLRLVAAGRTNREISEELVVSVRTVERHIDHIYEKLGVHTRVQATALAIRNGLDGLS